jgi:hypothetical protein
MLRVAYEHGNLLRLPVIRALKEAAPRQGFFERAQFETVRAHLPEDLQVAVNIAYAFGWRMQSEVLTLERRHVDLEAGTLRLDAAQPAHGADHSLRLSAHGRLPSGVPAPGLSQALAHRLQARRCARAAAA